MLTRDPVVDLCLAALAATAAWVALVAASVLREVWLARREGRRASLRRAVLVCCGVALTVPAGQASADDRFDGLPMPDRAVGPARPSVVVSPGDCLWDLAAAGLPATASPARITARWHAIYRLNRGVIGADPDLIHPGQVLVLPISRTSRSAS